LVLVFALVDWGKAHTYYLFLRKLHLVSEDTQVVSMEDRGLKGFDSSLNAKEKSENRPQRFKIKTINVGVVKEGGEDHK